MGINILLLLGLLLVSCSGSVKEIGRDVLTTDYYVAKERDYSNSYYDSSDADNCVEYREESVDSVAEILSGDTNIEISAFEDKCLEGHMIIPEGITSIRSYAFYNNDLTKVTIPSTVTYIGIYAFYENKYLTEVCIKALKEDITISWYAFPSGVDIIYSNDCSFMNEASYSIATS